MTRINLLYTFYKNILCIGDNKKLNMSNNKQSCRSIYNNLMKPKVYTEFKWSLQNCKMLFSLDQKIFRSGNFHVLRTNQLTCHMSLNISYSDFSSYLNVNLETSELTKSLRLAVTVCIVARGGQKVRAQTKIVNVKESITKDTLCFAMPSLLDLKDPSNFYIVDDSLTFFCEVEVVRKNV